MRDRKFSPRSQPDFSCWLSPVQAETELTSSALFINELIIIDTSHFLLVNMMTTAEQQSRKDADRAKFIVLWSQVIAARIFPEGQNKNKVTD